MYLFSLILVVFFHVSDLVPSQDIIKNSVSNNVKLTIFIFERSIQFKKDSVRNKTLKDSMKWSYKEKNWDLFHKYQKEYSKFTLKQNDSLGYANALEYRGAYFRDFNKKHIDSAYYYYYKSFDVYSKLNDSLKAAKILLSLAIIQKHTHDYIGSEAASFRGLEYLKSSSNLRRKSSFYNNLGFVYAHLNDMENSIKYHTKAFQLRKEIKQNPIYFVQSLNNIGKVYKNNGQYKQAIEYFRKTSQYDSILNKYPVYKAIILGNYTHARFKHDDTKDILTNYLKTLSFFETEDYLDGIIMSCMHIAEYYHSINDKEKAIEYAKRAKETSQLIHNYEDYLASIELLSRFYEKQQVKDTYFNKYISVRDSLDVVAKNHKDQFARIRFETDKKSITIENQNQTIKKKHLINIIVSSITILIIISIIFFLLRKRKIERRLKKELMHGFKPYLMNKYSLTNQNFEFWEVLATGLDQNQISEKLFISIEAIKSRRRSLKNKINQIEKIEGNFDKTKAVILFNKELELYKTHLSKKEE